MKYAKAEDIVSNANAPSHGIENFNHMRNNIRQKMRL